MDKGVTLKKIVKLADYLDTAGDYRGASIVDYFIKKFADNDPKRLAEVFEDIPNEEKPDLILAIKEAKELEKKAAFNIKEQEHLLIEDIYENIRNSDYNPNEEFSVEKYGKLTLGEIFKELGIV